MKRFTDSSVKAKATIGAYCPPCFSLLSVPTATLSSALRGKTGPDLYLRSLSSWFLRDFFFSSLVPQHLQFLFTASFCPVLKHAQGIPVLRKYLPDSAASWSHLLLLFLYLLVNFPNKRSTSVAFIFSPSFFEPLDLSLTAYSILISPSMLSLMFIFYTMYFAN